MDSFCYGMDFAYVLSCFFAPEKIMMENVRQQTNSMRNRRPRNGKGRGLMQLPFSTFQLPRSRLAPEVKSEEIGLPFWVHFIIHPHRIDKHQVISGQILLSKELRTGWRDHHAGTFDLKKSRLDQNFYHCFISTSYSHLWDLFLIPWRSIAASSLSSTFFTSWIAGT